MEKSRDNLFDIEQKRAESMVEAIGRVNLKKKIKKKFRGRSQREREDCVVYECFFFFLVALRWIQSTRQ